MSKEIKFTFYPDGRVEMEVNGVTGPSCTELTAPFEKELGVTDGNVTKKAEYDEIGPAKVKETVGH